MTISNYLLIHKDHPLDLRGIGGGAEMATLWLARTLARRGKRVVVAAQLQGSEETWNNVEFWDLGPDFDVPSVLKRARELDAYHLIASCRALAILMAKDEVQCKSRIFAAHDPSGSASGINNRVLCRVADRITCVSEAQKGLFLQAGAVADKIEVIPNGADLDIFAPGAPAERDYKQLIFVGALVQDKGIDVLLRTFAWLKQRVPELKLDVYGSAGMWQREALFDPTEVERAVPGVKFRGAVSQQILAEAYRKAGLCVIPSIWFDSFPLVAVEAQVSGCPVVSFDVGGIKEAYIPAETGSLVAEISDQALGTEVLRLVTSPETLSQMSERAALHARAKYNWDKVANRLVELCDEISSR